MATFGYSLEEESKQVPAMIGKYKVIKRCGLGAFAVVVLAYDTKLQTKVAIKVYNRKAIIENNMMAYIENEVRLHQRMDHPNIVKIQEVIYDQDNIMIVMDYCRNGDLVNILARGISFTPSEQISIFRQLVDAINYLHSRGICVRDIKPENILFDDDFKPILIDFGLARENGYKMKTFCGTQLYIAPEVISSDSYNAFEADIWSLGVTMHILCTSKFPWENLNDAKIISQMVDKKLEIINRTNGIIGFIIGKMLVFNPEERPTAQQICEYFENYLNKPIVHPKSADIVLKAKRTALPKIGIRRQVLPRENSEMNFSRMCGRIKISLKKR